MIKCPDCSKAAWVRETHSNTTRLKSNIVDICICSKCGCEFKREFDIQYTILVEGEKEND